MTNPTPPTYEEVQAEMIRQMGGIAHHAHHDCDEAIYCRCLDEAHPSGLHHCVCGHRWQDAARAALGDTP